MKCQTINNKIKNAQHRNQIQQRNKEENEECKTRREGWEVRRSKEKIANRVLQRRRKLNIYVEMRGEEITHSKL